MKKTTKTLALICLMALLLCTTTVPTWAADIDTVNTINRLISFNPFMVFGLMGFGCIFAFVVFWMIITAKKLRKLDIAIHELAINPCQETADVAVHEFTTVSGLIAFSVRGGGESTGVHFTMWRETFRHNVLPNKNIKAETKEALRKAMMRLGTYGLEGVVINK